MTESECQNKYDFLLERRLKELCPELHTRFRNSVFAMDRLLANYKNIFPFFTNHTFEHSEQVINYCNIIAGSEIIEQLNADEIYILLMGASLHDVGMGVSERDFNLMKNNIPELLEYEIEHPNELLGEYTRLFHQKLSAEFIKKYSELLEMPSLEYVDAIAKIASAHRKMNLLDENILNPKTVLTNGNTVNLPFLAALVKLADELDIASDRNIMFDYSKRDSHWSDKQTMCYKCHGAIKRLVYTDDALVLLFDTDQTEVYDEIMNTKEKVEKTFREFDEAVKLRTSFTDRIKEIRFEQI